MISLIVILKNGSLCHEQRKEDFFNRGFGSSCSDHSLVALDGASWRCPIICRSFRGSDRWPQRFGGRQLRQWGAVFWSHLLHLLVLMLIALLLLTGCTTRKRTKGDLYRPVSVETYLNAAEKLVEQGLLGQALHKLSEAERYFPNNRYVTLMRLLIAERLVSGKSPKKVSATTRGRNRIFIDGKEVFPDEDGNIYIVTSGKNEPRPGSINRKRRTLGEQTNRQSLSRSRSQSFPQQDGQTHNNFRVDYERRDVIPKRIVIWVQVYKGRIVRNSMISKIDADLYVSKSRKSGKNLIVNLQDRNNPGLNYRLVIPPLQDGQHTLFATRR